jgi:phosphatidylglycerophosphatase A
LKDRKIKDIYDLAATVMGLGYFPVAPGTAGSFAGMVICLALHRSPVLYVIVFAALFAAGVVSAEKAEKRARQKDPSHVVIDEFACVFVAFFLMPVKPFVILAGFLLYRIFDVIKIPPMRTLEKIEGGWGIMLDDLAAGIYTNLILHALLFFKLL